MSRGAESGTEGFILGAIATVVVVAALMVGCSGAAGHLFDPSPKDQANHACEQAWVDKNDGDPETVPAPIVDEPWCAQHNTKMTAPENTGTVKDITSGTYPGVQPLP